LNYLRRISGSVWGAKLRDLRQLYLVKLRPMISFACEVWYTPDDAGGWNAIKKRLESLERECLIQLSGAWGSTHNLTLLKELNIEPITHFLARSALARRARLIGTPHYTALLRLREKSILGLVPAHSALHLHPYYGFYDDAKLLRERAMAGLQPLPNNAPERPEQQLVRLGRLITSLAKSDVATVMDREWDIYRISRLAGRLELTFQIPALVQSWGDKSWRFYSKLDRPNATMLLQCRTSFIGLRFHLFDRKHDPDKLTSPLCLCNTGNHTVKHLLLDCPLLEQERESLLSQLGHLDFSLLLTQDAKVFTTWAILHFRLDHFESFRSTLTQP
jgi:hypothetical protein